MSSCGGGGDGLEDEEAGEEGTDGEASDGTAGIHRSAPDSVVRALSLAAGHDGIGRGARLSSWTPKETSPVRRWTAGVPQWWAKKTLSGEETGAGLLDFAEGKDPRSFESKEVGRRHAWKDGNLRSRKVRTRFDVVGWEGRARQRLMACSSGANRHGGYLTNWSGSETCWVSFGGKDPWWTEGEQAGDLKAVPLRSRPVGKRWTGGTADGSSTPSSLFGQGGQVGYGPWVLLVRLPSLPPVRYRCSTPSPLHQPSSIHPWTVPSTRV